MLEPQIIIMNNERDKMSKIKVAFATDDGKTFISRHFGDAKYYDIYVVDGDNAVFLKRIVNTVDEEQDIHADPQKARGISELIAKENISVVVSKVYGPNLKRIKKKFVCVIVKDKTLEEGIHKICKNIEKIYSEFERGSNREHLSL